MAGTGSSLTKRMFSVPDHAKPHMAMAVFMLVYSGNHVFMRAALDMGASKLVFPLYRNIIALVFLVPFAYFVERKDRPPLTVSLIIQFFLLGLVGITLNQGFYIFGLDNTSPTFASALENAVPAVTFILAALFRLEQVQLNSKNGVAKVLGTLTSVIGASVITLYKGPTIFGLNLPSNQSNFLLLLGDAKGKNWTLGCICLIGHCLCWSSWIVLQAFILKRYPARFSVYSFTCFFSVLQFLAIAAYIERDSQGWRVASGGELFSIFYAGLVVSGIGFGIQIWVIERGGPVFVSGYLPLQTFLAAVMSSIALGEEFYLGGIIGAVLIMAGLFLVVWGRSEESMLAAEKIAPSSTSGSNCLVGAGKSSLVRPLLPTSVE
ncbi:WAT1-related protein At3g53210-like isoform X1 [Tripterygium wilfordii]|uniref:WAT1-related protein At3g53210-like isoform X1 n=1 Tax=Tripterygium wilfordii TaxID=458696 RepID=UPI0018F822C4|nr:WAT1-related protein At3g53210-like isoform X1 [Tripterygium wilfordii]